MWQITETDTYIKNLKKLKKSGLEKDRLITAIKYLTSKDDPTLCGKPKNYNLKYHYAYDLGRSIRLIFRVDKENKIIWFINIGDHKDVY